MPLAIGLHCLALSQSTMQAQAQLLAVRSVRGVVTLGRVCVRAVRTCIYICTCTYVRTRAALRARARNIRASAMRSLAGYIARPLTDLKVQAYTIQLPGGIDPA